MTILKIIKIIIFFATFNIIIINTSYSNNYVIDNDKSFLTFSGSHAGNEFVGHINNYQSDIFFDQNNLINSKVKIIFAMDHLKTKNDLYNKTLPTKDWFDIKNHPTSSFESKKIIKKSNGNYQMIGDLTIKNITKKINFDFNLKNIKKNLVNISSNFLINRLDFNIGTQSDPDGQWVDLKIKINLNLTAISE
jgi:polyisoprenoid-binding protein YceI